MKDIFIDNNLTKNFVNPIDKHYQELLKWLIEYDEEKVEKNIIEKSNFAHLVVNQKLLVEYLRTNYNCGHSSSISTIINIFTRQGRLIKMTNKEIEDYKLSNLTKAKLKSLASNDEDHCHICSILNSTRKLVLTYDKNLTKDLKSFKKFSITISSRPENLNYK